ncbi:hypothetical protein FF2_008991 [Malus domestica]
MQPTSLQLGSGLREKSPTDGNRLHACPNSRGPIMGHGDCSKWSSTVKRRIKHVVAVIREVGPKIWSSEMMGFTRKFKGDPEKDGRRFGT